MYIDRPHPAKCQQSCQSLERESHDKSWQVDQSHRVNRVQRMLPMRREPIQVFGAVMNRMKSPQKTNPMLQAMSPINEQVTEQNHLHSLQPPWLCSHPSPKSRRHPAIHPAAEQMQQCQDRSSP